MSSTQLGSVDAGSTQTDTLALERQRGITIKSAVVSFVARRRHRQPDRHARSPGLHRRGRAGAGRARRRGAGDLRGRGRAGADPGADADAAPAAHPDADLRQQDRPAPAPTPSGCCAAIAEQAHAGRRARWARSATSGTRGADCHAVRPDRRSPSPTGCSTCSPSRTTRCSPPASRTTPSLPYPRLRAELGDADRPGAGAPGVRRLGDHRCRRGRADRRRSPSCCPPPQGDADGPVVRHRVQDRARAGRREDRAMCGSSPARSGCATGCRVARRSTRNGHRRSGSSTAGPTWSGVGRSRAGQIARLWGLSDARIGDPVGRPRRTRHGPPFRAAHPGDRGGAAPARPTGRAARRADPARRAGPADQPAAGRPAARDVRVALRRGAEGGHPGHPCRASSAWR